MKRLILMLAFLTLVDLSAQIRELKAIKKDKLETSFVDSMDNLFSIYSNSDSTVIFRYDDANARWSFISSLQRGNQADLVYLQSVSGWNGGAYISGLKDTGGFAVMFYYQGTWKKLAKMVKTGISDKEQLYHKFYRFKNDVYFVTNADTMVGASKGHVYKVTPNGLVNLNFNANAKEYHLTTMNDTVILGAQTKLYYYANGNWNIYKQLNGPVNNTVTGLEYIYGKVHYVQGDSFLRMTNGVNTDSISMGTISRIQSVGNRLYLFPVSYQLSTDIRYHDSSGGVLPAFRLKDHDSLPLQIATNNKKAYVYFMDENPIIFGNVNMGRVAELEISNYSISYYDKLYLRPFLDHNKNRRHDPGEQIVSVYFRELDGKRVFNNPTGNDYLYLAYDNEYMCFIAPERINSDSCYELTFSGARCGNHYNSTINTDTLYFPYQTNFQEGLSNVRITVTQSRNCRLNTNVPSKIKIWRDDCQSGSVSGFVKLTVPANAVVSNFNPAYSSKSGNVYTFNFNLGTQGVGNYEFDIMYPSASFSYGMVEKVKATIEGTSNELTQDNTDSAEHRLKYSFDPNAKICVPEGRVTVGLETIRFHIDFQNEGNDYAQRVVVVDTLSLNIPVYEFKMLGSSHNYKLSHKDNVVTWTFDDINLWPKSQSEAFSKGFIEFEAKVNGRLRIGDSITNSASIYFDHNEPIITNTSKVERVTRLDDLRVSQLMGIYPNPANDFLHIYNKSGESRVVRIYDAMGKEISCLQIGESEEMSVSTQSWASGVYLIFIEGLGTYRIVH